MDNLNFSDFLNSRLRDRGMNLKRLSELSGIALKHLEALSSGNFKALPSPPYVRGYLKRIGALLDFDGEEWWKKLKDEGAASGASGGEDKMPENRFLSTISGKAAWAAAAGVVFAVYLLLQFWKITGVPKITVAFPADNPAISAEEEISFHGTTDADELQINGEFVRIEGETWEKEALLEPGLNSFEITAKKFLGGEKKIIRQIIYEPAEAFAEEGRD